MSFAPAIIDRLGVLDAWSVKEVTAENITRETETGWLPRIANIMRQTKTLSTSGIKNTGGRIQSECENDAEGTV